METLELKEPAVTATKKKGLEYFNVAPGVWGMRIVFVNVYIIATEANNWILVDAGLKGYGNKIRKMAEDIFGAGARPKAIILTHAHFDHVGALEELSALWHVPIYAHPLEMPYLKGLSSYPPPDPFVGGGLMSLMSWSFPRSPKKMGRRVFKLPADGTLPMTEEWRSIHTPGHAPGHISLFRDSDKTLIAGDAFVTTKQESAFSVMTQKKEISGPPKYFTIDWQAAGESVRNLSDLEPEVAATGHGLPVKGIQLRNGLTVLAENFNNLAVPKAGRYVKHPAEADEKGVIYVPERYVSKGFIATVAAISALAAFAAVWQLNNKKKKGWL
jgi:glyoxylase-like metal-dependent hydrolase (beta-lactamase superfamily II)